MDFTRIFDFVGVIPDGAKYVAALIFVLLLILLAGLVLKKISSKVRRRSSDGGRLKVGESIMLDSQRTLTLVSCDDVEHLILLSDTNDLVIAANINNPDSAVRHQGFTETEERVVETAAPVHTAAPAHTAAPVHAAAQTPSASSPRAVSSQEPTRPLPQAPQPSRHREASRNTAVQALAKPAPRPRPSTLPPGPGRRAPETRPHPVPAPHSEAGQLNGEEGIGAEDAASQSFAEIRPGDEK